MKKNKKKKKQKVQNSQQFASSLPQHKLLIHEPNEYMLMCLTMENLENSMGSLANDLREVRDNAELVCDFMHTMIDRIDDILEMIDNDECDDEDDVDPFDMEDDDE